MVVGTITASCAARTFDLVEAVSFNSLTVLKWTENRVNAATEIVVINVQKFCVAIVKATLVSRKRTRLHKGCIQSLTEIFQFAKTFRDFTFQLIFVNRQLHKLLECAQIDRESIRQSIELQP